MDQDQICLSAKKILLKNLGIKHGLLEEVEAIPKLIICFCALFNYYDRRLNIKENFIVLPKQMSN